MLEVMLGPLIFVIIGVVKLKNYHEEKQEYKELEQRYEYEYIHAQKAYEFELRAYESSVIKENTRFEKAMADYLHDNEVYNEESKAIMERHDSALIGLERALQELYDQNVVFPKYRNMVAITTINEYLSSGRCFELEGPNGAYNLYEMELRQNIVIGQLATVVDNLDQIKNNQFVLYREIVNTNHIVSEIVDELREIKAETKLNTYLSKVIAMSSITHNVLWSRISHAAPCHRNTYFQKFHSIFRHTATYVAQYSFY